MYVDDLAAAHLGREKENLYQEMINNKLINDVKEMMCRLLYQ